MSSQIKNLTKNSGGFSAIEFLVGITILIVVVFGARAAYNGIQSIRKATPKSFDVEGQSNMPVAPVQSAETAQSATTLTADGQKVKNWFANCSDLNTCLAQCKEDTDDDFCIAEYQKQKSAIQQPGELLPTGPGIE